MKKLVLFLLAFAAVSAQMNAQLTGIGVRPTLSLSTYKLSKGYNDIYDASLRVGGGLAAFAEFNLGNRFTFQPEIAFMQRGGNIRSETNVYWDGPDFGYPEGYKVVDLRQRETLNYIDIPLNFEKNFGGGNIGAYVSVGTTFSFAVGNGRGMEELTVEYPTSEGGVTSQIDRAEYTIEMGSGRNDDYKAYDFGLNLGAGVAFIRESGELSFDVRFVQGLRNVDVGSLKNRNLQFGISYMYYLGQ